MLFLHFTKPISYPEPKHATFKTMYTRDNFVLLQVLLSNAN